MQRSSVLILLWLKGELLVITGMLCHSKVWSRVWRHRCNVNMNPYISVSPFACFSSFDCQLFPKFILSCLSILCLPSVFIAGCSKCTSDNQAVCLDFFGPSSLSYFCASLSVMLAALSILPSVPKTLKRVSSWATEMYERNCIYR